MKNRIASHQRRLRCGEVYSTRRPEIARAITSCWISEVPSKINTVFGDSGGGKSWISLWAMVEQMLRGNDVVPPKIRKKGLFVDF
jgi:hypothetical protein